MNRGVKSFFVKGIIFVTPLLLLLGLIEYKLYHIPNGYNTKRKLLERQLDSIQVLVAGSSQTLHGINPAYFSCRGFNIANNSQSLFYDTQIALKYIDSMKHLKCVMLTISYFSLWNQLCDLPEDWRDSFYYYYWDIRYPALKMLNAKNYSLIMLYGTQNALQYTAELFHVDLTENMSTNGWIKIDTIHNNPQISDESGKKRVQVHNKLCHDYRLAENMAILEHFILECKKRNIDVAFVTPPAYKTYYKYIDTERNRKNGEAIKSLCQHYGCTYHDYFYDQRFTFKDFNDNDHLNYMGAAKWSVILDSDIVKAYSKDISLIQNQ